MARGGGSAGLPFGLIILLSPFAFIYSYCSSPDKPERQEFEKFASYEIYGLKVPGTMEDAKRAGFNECKPADNAYSCVRRKPFIFEGVKITSASLELNDHENFAIKPWEVYEKHDANAPSVLTYGSVKLIPAVSKDEFKDALIKKGWIEHGWKGNSALYHSGLPIEIVLGRSSEDLISVSQVENSLVESYVSEQKKEIERETEKQQKDKQVVEMMKGNS